MLAALVAVPSLKMPPVSPTGAPNRLWDWRGYKVRYQALGEEQDGPAVLLVHGLFVNADHWRKNLPALAEAGFRVVVVCDFFQFEPVGDEHEYRSQEAKRDREADVDAHDAREAPCAKKSV